MIILLILNQITLLKDIREDQRNWKIYVWLILWLGSIVKVTVIKKANLNQIHH